MYKHMNLNTNLYLILFIFISTNLLGDGGQEKILRDAILKNGYKSPEDLYIANDELLVDEGKIFFKSKHLSLNGKISCATCHINNQGSSDGIPNAAGIRGFGEGKERLLSGAAIVPRNTLGLWGVGSKNFLTFFWDGRVDFANEKVLSQFGTDVPSLDPLITAVHLPVVEIRETLDEDEFVLLHKKETISGAQQVYAQIVTNLIENENDAMKKLANKRNIQIDQLTFLDIATSIAAFIRSEFRIKKSPLDSFIKGESNLTKKQMNGGFLFYGKGNCISCHSGAHFSDQKFYTIPFPQLGFGKNGFGVDYGRYNATFNPDDLYKFRTPSLYNNGKTAPYGHSGSAKSLYEAIQAHYDPFALVKLNEYDDLERHQLYKYFSNSDAANKVNYLTKKEVDHLVEFLKTMDFN